MPIFDTEITELSEHILHPVISQCVNKVVFDLGLSEIIKNNIDIRTGRTGVSKSRDKDRNQKLRHDRLECTATPQLNPLGVLWNEVTTFSHTNAYGRLKPHLHDKYCVLKDPSSQVFLYEQSSPCSIQIACNLILLDDDIAYGIPAKFYNKYLDGSVVQIEELTFDYPITNKMLYVLNTIYKHRTDLKLPFTDYLRICSANEISSVINQNDVATQKEKIRSEIVVKKLLTNAFLKVEYTEERPTEEKNEKVATEFQIPFTITVQFSRPNTLSLVYPISINNKLLPSEVIPIRNNRVLDNIISRYSHVSSENYFEAFSNKLINYIQLPYYDDWTQPLNSILKARSYREILVGAFTLDVDKDTTNINLDEAISDFKLHPYVRQIIRAQCRGSFDHDCLFNISIFRNDDIIQPCQMDIDNDLNVIIPCTHTTCQYHIIVSELRDMSYLNPKYRWLVEDYGDFFDKSITDSLDKLYPGWRDDNDYNNKGGSHGSHIPFRILIADIIAEQP